MCLHEPCVFQLAVCPDCWRVDDQGGGRCSSKYLISSMRFCYPALDPGRYEHPDCYGPGSVAQHLAGKPTERQEGTGENKSGKLVFLSLWIYFVCEAEVLVR